METACFEQAALECNSDLEQRDEGNENHSDQKTSFVDSYMAEYNSEATAV